MAMSDKQAALEKYDADEAMIRRQGPLGGLASFNIEYGFVEAVLRGFRSGFLKDFEYRQLCQCDNLDDVKLALGDTDYLNVLQNVNQKLTPALIMGKVQEKYIAEFQFLRSQANGPLATFLDYITFEYMIKNISFVITSLIKGADHNTLLSKCHPLGKTPHLNTILSFENTADGLLELYRVVIVDTPVAPYFETYFNKDLHKEQPGQSIQQKYSEENIELITIQLSKLWLEDFYNYTQTLGGETAEIMKTLLEFEADKRAIEITMNSFGTPLNTPNKRDSDRKALYCNFGTLYPEATQDTFSKVSDMNQLASALENYSVFRELWKRAQEGSSSFTDQLYAYEVYLHKMAFDSQSHFAAFYGFIKLKSQEERNLKWIVSCIDQRREKKEFNRWVKIF